MMSDGTADRLQNAVTVLDEVDRPAADEVDAKVIELQTWVQAVHAAVKEAMNERVPPASETG
jgi:hypothetical protein